MASTVHSSVGTAGETVARVALRTAHAPDAVTHNALAEHAPSLQDNFNTTPVAAAAAPRASQPLPLIPPSDIPAKAWTLLTYMAVNTHLDEAGHACFTQMLDSRATPDQMNNLMFITGGDRDKTDPVLWPNRSRLVWLPSRSEVAQGKLPAYEIDLRGTEIGTAIENHPVLAAAKAEVFRKALASIGKLDAVKDSKVLLDLWSDGNSQSVLYDQPTDGVAGTSVNPENESFTEALQSMRVEGIINDICEANSLIVEHGEARGAPDAIAISDEHEEVSWNYAKLLQGLERVFARHPQPTNAQLVKVFSRQYGDYANAPMAAVPLAAIPHVLDARTKLARAMIDAGGFGNRSLANTFKVQPRIDQSAVFDLGRFSTDLVKRQRTPATVKAAAQNMLEVLKENGIEFKGRRGPPWTIGTETNMRGDTLWNELMATRPVPASAPAATPAPAPAATTTATTATT